MAASQTLIGLGVPARQANALGFQVGTKTGVGTAQVGGTTITNNITITTTAGGATAFVLPASVVGAGPLVITNPNSTSALIFPDLGGTINGGSLNASVSLAQNKTMVFFRSAALTWIGLLGA